MPDQRTDGAATQGIKSILEPLTSVCLIFCMERMFSMVVHCKFLCGKDVQYGGALQVFGIH